MKKRGSEVENVRRGEVDSVERVNEEDWVVCLCAHLCTQKSRVHTASVSVVDPAAGSFGGKIFRVR